MCLASIGLSPPFCPSALHLFIAACACIPFILYCPPWIYPGRLIFYKKNNTDETRQDPPSSIQLAAAGSAAIWPGQPKTSPKDDTKQAKQYTGQRKPPACLISFRFSFLLLYIYLVPFFQVALFCLLSWVSADNLAPIGQNQTPNHAISGQAG